MPINRATRPRELSQRLGLERIHFRFLTATAIRAITHSAAGTTPSPTVERTRSRLLATESVIGVQER